jgi:hypothetical protein
MSLDLPFSDKLRKNYIAQLGEEAGIKTVIEHQRTVIQELDVELEDVDQAITALTSRKTIMIDRRDTHQQFIDDHRSLLFGVLHLPEDILSKIFMESVPPRGQWPRIHPIVQITHVCRQWRDSAPANPMLWTTLEVNNLSIPTVGRGGEPDLGRFERWMGRLADMFPILISRAGGFPLILAVHAEDPAFHQVMPSYARSVLPVLNILRESRWGKISLHLTAHYPDSPLLSLLHFGVQSCESLRAASLTLCSYGASLASAGGIAGHLNVDDMKQLSMLHLDINKITLLQARIRWGSLTGLHLSRALPARDLLGILAQCPILTRFSTTVANSSTSPQLLLPEQRVTLAHLHTLKIVGETGEIAHGLVLPSLSALQVMEVRTGRSDTSIPQWLRSYGSQLQEVSFSYDRLDAPALLGCLNDASAVISLEIGPCPIAPIPRRGAAKELFSSLHRYALDALTVKQGDSGAFTPVCPKLENIIVHAPDMKTRIGKWCEFLASRRRSMEGAAAFLKTAEIRLPDPVYCVEQIAVLTKHLEVHDGLAKRGISFHGIKFLIEKDVHWADY